MRGVKRVITLQFLKNKTIKPSLPINWAGNNLTGLTLDTYQHSTTRFGCHKNKGCFLPLAGSARQRIRL